VDGWSRASSTAAATSTSALFGIYRWGWGFSTSQDFNGDIALIACFASSWTPAMVRRWHADPFGFLRPWNELPALFGSAPPSLDRHRRGHLPDGVASMAARPDLLARQSARRASGWRDPRGPVRHDECSDRQLEPHHRPQLARLCRLHLPVEPGTGPRRPPAIQKNPYSSCNPACPAEPTWPTASRRRRLLSATAARVPSDCIAS
jgi:hypothetical protein